MGFFARRQDEVTVEREICLLLTGFAVVRVRLTPLTGVARLAHALVATHRVLANSTVATRGLDAFIDVNFTCLTLRRNEK